MIIIMEFPDPERWREVQVKHDPELNLMKMCFHFWDVFDLKLEKKAILLPVILPVDFRLTSGYVSVKYMLQFFSYLVACEIVAREIARR